MVTTEFHDNFYASSYRPTVWAWPQDLIALISATILIAIAALALASFAFIEATIPLAFLEVLLYFLARQHAQRRHRHGHH